LATESARPSPSVERRGEARSDSDNLETDKSGIEREAIDAPQLRKEASWAQFPTLSVA